MALKANHTLPGGIIINGVYIRAKAEVLHTKIIQEKKFPDAEEGTDESKITIPVKKFCQNYVLEIFKDKDSTERAAAVIGMCYIDPDKPTLSQVYTDAKNSFYPDAIDC